MKSIGFYVLMGLAAASVALMVLVAVLVHYGAGLVFLIGLTV